MFSNRELEKRMGELEKRMGELERKVHNLEQGQKIYYDSGIRYLFCDPPHARIKDLVVKLMKHLDLTIRHIPEHRESFDIVAKEEEDNK